MMTRSGLAGYHLDDSLVHISGVEENGIKLGERGEEGPVSGDITVSYGAVIGHERRLPETKPEHNNQPILTAGRSVLVSLEATLPELEQWFHVERIKYDKWPRVNSTVSLSTKDLGFLSIILGQNLYEDNYRLALTS